LQQKTTHKLPDYLFLESLVFLKETMMLESYTDNMSDRKKFFECLTELYFHKLNLKSLY